ncbi:hypothetical protein B277_13259 [Janibacter hoylei PVAS-1]|uniref:Uncharacterized protein n=1 Tax=Janibacter hoylei PVAS-1 TaxID=1210046 RepID=K1E021_9MICO|nr:hypothetical protein B277_13259 [Janibacter hoylei PVAS-1]RWU85784.1 hypothetical protein CWN80_02135 [Janibacter hoylei PVAS-1]
MPSRTGTRWGRLPWWVNPQAWATRQEARLRRAAYQSRLGAPCVKAQPRGWDHSSTWLCRKVSAVARS